MAFAEDMRVLLERIRGTERELMEQFVACFGVIDKRLKDLLVPDETRDVAAIRNIHMDPDMRALSAHHAGDTEGGVAWRRLFDEYERPQNGVPFFKNTFTTGSPETSEASWMSSRRCFANTAPCLEKTSANVSPFSHLDRKLFIRHLRKIMATTHTDPLSPHWHST